MTRIQPWRRPLILASLAMTGVVWSAWAASSEVFQKGRAFQPNAIQIHAGDIVTFTNNDGDLLHHAYLTTPQFSFDTGEQASGTQVKVRFSKAGAFTVLCGIHPKMRLAVTVE